MASGFIVLEDGRTFARNSGVFDGILENAIDVMDAELEEEKILKKWLKALLVKEEDIDMGWGFVRDIDGKTIARVIDFRGMSKVYCEILKKTIKHKKFIQDAQEFFYKEFYESVVDLIAMISLTEEGEDPLVGSDVDTVRAIEYHYGLV